MSYANFGPNYRETGVANLIGAIAIAASAANVPPTVTELVQDAGGNPIPLVLAAGTYSVHCRAVLNVANAASIIGFAQCSLSVSGGGALLAGSQIISGEYANGTNFSYFFGIDRIVTLAAPTSLAFTFAICGSDTIHSFIAGQTSMTATRLSA